METYTPNEPLWERVQKKPGMYLGERSITALFHTVYGYNWALGAHRIDADKSFRLPEDFHDWVAYRLRFYEATSGWKNMLLKACGGEEEGFRRFFELLEEHQLRTKRVFAIADCEKEIVSESGTETSRHRVELVTFTDGPGFFTASDQLTDRWCRCYHPLFDREHWTSLRIASERLGVSEVTACRHFEILDTVIVKRLEAEAEAHAEGKRPFRD